MNNLILILVLSLLTLTGCSTESINDSYPVTLVNHSLSGKIWDVKAKHFIEREVLLENIHQSNFIFLGETHDNTLHHEYQAWVIDNLYTSGFTALVAMEMINSAQGEIIKNKPYESSVRLIDDLNLVKTTWRYESRYKVLFDSILHAGYKFLPANLDRKSIVEIAMKGKENIPPGILSYLKKNPLSDKQKMDLKEEIIKSHCGMENPHMVNAMMLTQSVKDAVMADSMLRNISVDKRILISGSGHARSDRGVPMYIRGEKRDARILSLAWLEVIDQLNEVKQYSEQWGDSSLPFDYVWFTPRVNRPDPCESFRQHMKTKKIKKDGHVAK
jgi:uncharacterized iron-regulated protein